MISLQDIYKEYKSKNEQIDNLLCISQNEPNRQLIDKIIKIPLEELQKKSAYELSEMAVVLSQYCIFLQNYENKSKDFNKWLQRKLNILGQNDKHKANKWLGDIETRLQKLSYLCKRIENMMQCLLNLSKIKQFRGE